MHLHNICKFVIVSVHSFSVLKRNLVSINYMEWLAIPACPSLMYLLTTVILKGLPLPKIVSDVCVHVFCFMLV